jgi:hypothetical protein
MTRDQAPVKIDIDVKGVEYLLLMIDGKRIVGNGAEAKVMAGGRSSSRQYGVLTSR